MAGPVAMLKKKNLQSGQAQLALDGKLAPQGAINKSGTGLGAPAPAPTPVQPQVQAQAPRSAAPPLSTIPTAGGLGANAAIKAAADAAAAAAGRGGVGQQVKQPGGAPPKPPGFIDESIAYGNTKNIPDLIGERARGFFNDPTGAGKQAVDDVKDVVENIPTPQDVLDDLGDKARAGRDEVVNAGKDLAGNLPQPPNPMDLIQQIMEMLFGKGFNKGSMPTSDAAGAGEGRDREGGGGGMTPVQVDPGFGTTQAFPGFGVKDFANSFAPGVTGGRAPSASNFGGSPLSTMTQATAPTFGSIGANTNLSAGPVSGGIQGQMGSGSGAASLGLGQNIASAGKAAMPKGGATAGATNRDPLFSAAARAAQAQQAPVQGDMQAYTPSDQGQGPVTPGAQAYVPNADGTYSENPSSGSPSANRPYADNWKTPGGSGLPGADGLANALNVPADDMTRNDIRRLKENVGSYNDLNKGALDALGNSVNDFSTSGQMGLYSQQGAREMGQRAIDRGQQQSLMDLASRRSRGGQIGTGSETGIANAGIRANQDLESGLQSQLYGQENQRLQNLSGVRGQIANTLTHGSDADMQNLMDSMTTNKELFGSFMSMIPELLDGLIPG